MASLEVKTTLKGPLFSTNLDGAAKRAVREELVDKVEERVLRVPRSPKLGRKNNTLSSRQFSSANEESMEVDSTLNWPRTKGTAWLAYNLGAVRKMAPNVVRAIARRLAQEAGGS